MDLTELLAFKPSSSSKRPHEQDEEEGVGPPKRAARNGAGNHSEGQLSDKEKLQLLLSLEDEEEDGTGET